MTLISEASTSNNQHNTFTQKTNTTTQQTTGALYQQPHPCWAPTKIHSISLLSLFHKHTHKASVTSSLPFQIFLHLFQIPSPTLLPKLQHKFHKHNTNNLPVGNETSSELLLLAESLHQLQFPNTNTAHASKFTEQIKQRGQWTV